MFTGQTAYNYDIHETIFARKLGSSFLLTFTNVSPKYCGNCSLVQ